MGYKGQVTSANRIACVICKKEFTAQGKRKTCGSNECKTILYEQRYGRTSDQSPLLLIPRKCSMCDREFKPSSPRVKYCSRECRGLAKRSTTDQVYPMGGGYLCMTGPTARAHPAVTKHGWAQVHVMVAYDTHGPGPHRCEWCNCEIDWFFGKGQKELMPGQRKITVDHRNWNKHDNRAKNLALSCIPCNSGRQNPEKKRRAGMEK